MIPMLSLEPILCLDSALYGVSEMLLQKRSKDVCSKLRYTGQGGLKGIRSWSPQPREEVLGRVSEGGVGIVHRIKNRGPRLWLYTFDPLTCPPGDLPSWGLLKR